MSNCPFGDGWREGRSGLTAWGWEGESRWSGAGVKEMRGVVSGEKYSVSLSLVSKTDNET